MTMTILQKGNLVMILKIARKMRLWDMHYATVTAKMINYHAKNKIKKSDIVFVEN